MTETRFAGYAYARHQEQREDLRSQLEAIESFASLSGVSVEPIYQDVGTGPSAYPPGLSQMLAAAEQGEFDILVIADTSCLVNVGPRFLDLWDRPATAGIAVACASWIKTP